MQVLRLNKSDEEKEHEHKVSKERMKKEREKSPAKATEEELKNKWKLMFARNAANSKERIKIIRANKTEKEKQEENTFAKERMKRVRARKLN